MNVAVDKYFIDGCGRCLLVGTAACKVKTWEKELHQLRALLLACGLDEKLKWSHPCYTHQGNNIAILGTTKQYCAIGFFKGVLLQDPAGILTAQTENMQSTRQIRFTGVKAIAELEPLIQSYIYEAIEVEKAGLKVTYKKTAAFNVPEAFQEALSKNPALKDAFEQLTPGRQRAYLLHFSQPKQAKTSRARIEKYLPKILDGKGMND